MIIIIKLLCFWQICFISPFTSMGSVKHPVTNVVLWCNRCLARDKQINIQHDLQDNQHGMSIMWPYMNAIYTTTYLGCCVSLCLYTIYVLLRGFLRFYFHSNRCTQVSYRFWRLKFKVRISRVFKDFQVSVKVLSSLCQDPSRWLTGLVPVDHQL